jgi:hypothetical protein
LLLHLQKLFQHFLSCIFLLTLLLEPPRQFVIRLPPHLRRNTATLLGTALGRVAHPVIYLFQILLQVLLQYLHLLLKVLIPFPRRYYLVVQLLQGL